MFAMVLLYDCCFQSGENSGGVKSECLTLDQSPGEMNTTGSSESNGYIFSAIRRRCCGRGSLNLQVRTLSDMQPYSNEEGEDAIDEHVDDVRRRQHHLC